VTRIETLRSHLVRLHVAGGAPFAEDSPGSGVFSWRAVLGRWPVEVQVDRYAQMVRCYVGDELFGTGRVPERESQALVSPASGPGDGAALAAMADFVDAEIRSDSRRFLRPPHADRHADRRQDARQESVVRALPGRRVDEPT